MTDSPNERVRSLRELFDDAPVMVTLTRGPDHVYEYLNRSALENASGARSDLIGRSIRASRPELVANGYLELYDGVFRTGKSFVANEAHVPLKGADGARIDRVYRFSLTPWRDSDGRIGGVLGNAVDITDEVAARSLQRELLRQTEELRAEAEEERRRLAQLIDVIPVGVVIYGRDGAVLMGNRARQRIIGEAGKATDVRTSVAYLQPVRADGRPFELDDLPVMRALRGETVRAERMRVRVHGGAEVVVLTSAAPLRDANGEIHSAVQFFQELDPQD